MDMENNPVSKYSSTTESFEAKSSNTSSEIIDMKEKEKELPWLLNYISCIVHLAVFGILGVLTRYLLQKLFGPDVVGFTSENSSIYLDLSSNMVGSFLMGWFGVVFKRDISQFSDHLAIGLSTGYLGSLTTFSGWNQSMLELSVQGKWVFVVLGFLLGLVIASGFLILGIDSALGFKILLKHFQLLKEDEKNSKCLKNINGQFAVILMFLIMLGLLWALSVILAKREFNNNTKMAHLWVGCIVGPFGVWIRWILSRINGRGLGRTSLFNWIPFGTLLANVSAAWIMAALALLKIAVNGNSCQIISTGIQFGFLGCLSTVSTFISEFHAMKQSKYAWRAYMYAFITFTLSFGFGTIIYSVPIWKNLV